MTRLPVVSGRDAVRAFSKIGYRLDHQSGSHLILRSLIREAGLSVDEFSRLL